MKPQWRKNVGKYLINIANRFCTKAVLKDASLSYIFVHFVPAHEISFFIEMFLHCEQCEFRNTWAIVALVKRFTATCNED